MDWLKKKKDEAKQAASQAAAKIQNKRTPTFKGEGNVLGGGDSASSAPPPPAPGPAPARGFKVPAFGKFKAEPPPLTEEEKQQRREAQAKALENRTNAWDKRVANARKARLQQEAELENKFEMPPPPPPSSAQPASANSGPAPRVLSAEEMKAYEVQRAQAQMGFNPYNAVFSSSSEANTVINSVSASSSAPALPPPALGHVASPARTDSAGYASSQTHLRSDGAVSPLPEASADGGGVYVLLRQDPKKAIAAAQTVIKMLGNVLKSPEEEKFRKIRLANASIQTKLVAVGGAVDLLREAGFAPVAMDGEQFLVLAADAFDAARVQAALDRTEVACIQLQVDSADISV